MMPVVPPCSHILVLDMAAKTSVCAGLHTVRGAGPVRRGQLLSLIPRHPFVAIPRVTLETRWLFLALQFGKLLPLWRIRLEYNLLLCAWGCGLHTPVSLGCVPFASTTKMLFPKPGLVVGGGLEAPGCNRIGGRSASKAVILG